MSHSFLRYFQLEKVNTMLNYQGCNLVNKDLGMTKRCNVAHLVNKHNQSQNSRNCIIHHIKRPGQKNL